MAETKSEKRKAEPVFVVAEGRSITSIRGPVHGGDVVSERDFAGGAATFKSLLEAKAIVERK